MTGKPINTKSETLRLRELSSEELDAVSGGDKATEAQQAEMENKKQAEALKTFQQLLQQL